MLELGLRQDNPGLGACHRGGSGADLLSRQLQRRLRILHRELVVSRVDTEQYVTGSHDLVLVDADVDDSSGHLRNNRDYVGLHSCLVGPRREPVREYVPKEQE